MKPVSESQRGTKSRRPPPSPCPAHARLLADVAALREHAAAIVRAHRRVGYLRPGSAENLFLNAVSWALEHQELLYSLAARGEGTLVLDVDRGEDGFGRPKLSLRPLPAKVIDLGAYRAARAAAAG